MSKRVFLGTLLVGLSFVIAGCPIDDAKYKEPSGGVSSSSSDASSSSAGGAGGMTSSSSTGGSGGGVGGGSGGGGAGGSGGGAMSSSSSSGTGGGPVCPAMPGTPGACGVTDCPPCRELVLVGAGDPAGVYATFKSPGSWVATPYSGEKSADPPSFANIPDKAEGVVFLRRSDTGKLRFAPVTSTGLGSFADFDTTTTWSGVAAIAASSTALHIVTRDLTLSRYHYAEMHGGTFTVVPQQIDVGGSFSLGDVMAGLTVLGSDLLLVNDDFNDGASQFWDQARVNNAWQGAQPHPITFSMADATPAVVALSPTKALAVFTESTTNQLFSFVKTNGTWGPQTAITGAMSTEPVLTALANGDALLAYREPTTGNISWARYQAATSTWTAPKPFGKAAAAKVALAEGTGDAEAELAYIDKSSSKPQHARLQNGSFTAPVQITNTSVDGGVAIATRP